MSGRSTEITWRENPRDIIVLADRSSSNFILELPAGRYRLDAGRRMRTLRSVANYPQVKELIEKGELIIEV